MGRHFSDELFHFVGFKNPCDDEKCFESLLAILRDGYISHYPHAKEWGAEFVSFDPSRSLVRGDLVVPEIVCFCDIPLEHLQDHVTRYGRFGLSIDKSYAVGFGARPVMYMPYRTDDWRRIYGMTMLKDIEASFKVFKKYVDDQGGDEPRPPRSLTQAPTSHLAAEENIESMFRRHFLAFLKPFNSELPEDHRDYYYAEKEWRRLGNMKIEPECVRHIVVAKGFEDRLAAAFPCYANRVAYPPGRPA